VPVSSSAQRRSWTAAELASVLDHTLLAPEAIRGRVDRLCDEALEHGFAAVCVNPCHVTRCAGRLARSPVVVCSVVGFPFGASTTSVKVHEARAALEDGARELDMVMNLGALRSDDDAFVERDVALVVEVARHHGALVKVILETGLLSPDEVRRACAASVAGGAAFVKTCTGFGPRGTTRADVELLRASVPDHVGVKAAGGVRTRAFALELLEAGATRLGSSASVELVRPA